MNVLTVNTHKGFSVFNRNFVLDQLKEAIRLTHADIVFLQEVTGENEKKRAKYEAWPEKSHYEFLADQIWDDYAYGKNAVYPAGHHGNAILSKYPIDSFEQVNISTNFVEQRGFLYTEICLPTSGQKIHCICVHLGLFSKSRKKQMAAIRHFIRKRIPEKDSVLVAGDFNDWTKKSKKYFVKGIGLREVFFEQYGSYARTFPSWMPILKLDRIYQRGFKVRECQIHEGAPWPKLSDHLALSAKLTLASD